MCSCRLDNTEHELALESGDLECGDIIPNQCAVSLAAPKMIALKLITSFLDVCILSNKISGPANVYAARFWGLFITPKTLVGCGQIIRKSLSQSIIPTHVYIVVFVLQH